MIEIRSKAPLPLTMYKIESEVFSLRTKERTPPSIESVTNLALRVNEKDKKARDLAAVVLAATCARIIEEIG